MALRKVIRDGICNWTMSDFLLKEEQGKHDVLGGESQSEKAGEEIRSCISGPYHTEHGSSVPSPTQGTTLSVQAAIAPVFHFHEKVKVREHKWKQWNAIQTLAVLCLSVFQREINWPPPFYNTRYNCSDPPEAWGLEGVQRDHPGWPGHTESAEEAVLVAHACFWSAFQCTARSPVTHGDCTLGNPS